MVSERIQRRIDAFLDEADEAAASRNWAVVFENARAVLGIDAANEDALAFIQMAESAAGAGTPGNPSPGAASTSAPAPAPNLPASFVAGRYRVERFLGEGGRKRVFLAHDTTLERDIAFAQIRTEGLDDLARERVMREAQSMARMGAHPNLVSIFDIGEEGGNPHLVEEYMARGTVASLIEGGPPDVARTLRVATDVCRALSFMHEQGLIHRDLKPANVFLTEDGTAKVGDFGLAVVLDRSRITQQGSLVGTAAYMPPEQALGGEVTPQSDFYALGAMLYEMVAGRPPFAGDDATAVISQHINTPPVAPSWHTEHCPPPLEALILQMLNKDPAERPQTVEALLAALEAVDPEEQSSRHSDSDANPLEGLARGVFVGRNSELDRLKGAFDEAFAVRGSVVMVVGEPGIGKTRTTQELETYARMRGARVLWGRAHEASGAPAYWPWKQVGDSHARFVTPAEVSEDLDSAQAAELSRIFPVLGGQPAEATDAAAAQFRLYDAYTAFMRAGSNRAPLLIVLDDLHWADQPSLLLLQHMARELGRMRILIVGTYRDTDLSRTHPLSEALAELNREGGFQRVVLRGLSESEVGAYIHGVSNIEPSHGLVTRIFEETEGNPFFLSEVVNLMVQEGTIGADSVSDIAIPDGVREAIGRRLNLLSDEANELLTTAVVVGREFPFETLRELFRGGDDRDLVRLIDEGLGARVIEELQGVARYQFTHAQIQETLLAEISTTRRVLINGEIADALEERYGDRADERASRLAQHFYESATLTERHAQKAVHYSRTAAHQAEEQSGWAEAARHYEHCLTLLTAPGRDLDGSEAELLLRLGAAGHSSISTGPRTSFRSTASRSFSTR